jgi:hypothetical protein
MPSDKTIGGGDDAFNTFFSEVRHDSGKGRRTNSWDDETCLPIVSFVAVTATNITLPCSVA